MNNNKKELVQNDNSFVKLALTPRELQIMLRKLGYTQTDFAGLFGKSRSWLTKMLYGDEQFIPLIYIKTFAEHIGVDFFFELAQEIRENEIQSRGKI